jgi:hypothetical protein
MRKRAGCVCATRGSARGDVERWAKARDGAANPRASDLRFAICDEPISTDDELESLLTTVERTVRGARGRDGDDADDDLAAERESVPRRVW